MTDQARTEMSRPEDPAGELAASPLLGVLAALAALIDLLWTGGAVRSLSGELPHADLLRLARIGELPRNLAAISGVVALAAAIVAFLRTPRRGRIARGVALAGFGGIFLPILVVATILPIDVLARRWMYLVVFAVGAADFLALVVCTTAALRPAPLGIRISAGALGISAFLSFATVALASVPQVAGSTIGATIVITLSHAGELAWLLAPFAAASAILPASRDRRAAIALGVAIVTGAASAGLLLWAADLVRGDFPNLLYGLARTELFIDSLPAVYVIALAATVGIGAGGLASGDPPRVQGGAALLLLVASGYAPRTPARLLAFVLGAAMLARACIALGERMRAARRAEVRASRPETPTAAETNEEALETPPAS